MSQTPASEVALRDLNKVPEPLVIAWETIRNNLRRDCGPRTFDGWLRPVSLGSFDAESGTLRLELPSQFMADWVQTHFADRLALAWRTMMPAVRHVVIRAGADAPRTAATVQIPAAEPEVARPEDQGGLSSPQLEPRYRFDTFVVGKANEVAFNAARTLATADNVAFNPLFIHGGTGRGKTHLLHAIGHEFRARRPGAKVIYMSAE